MLRALTIVLAVTWLGGCEGLGGVEPDDVEARFLRTVPSRDSPGDRLAELTFHNRSRRSVAVDRYVITSGSRETRFDASFWLAPGETTTRRVQLPSEWAGSSGAMRAEVLEVSAVRAD